KVRLHMKKYRFLLLSMVLGLVLAGCGNSESAEESEEAAMKEYTTDAGETIEIPEDPQRIVVMATSYFGNFKQLDANMVGAHSDVTDSDVLEPLTEDVEMVEEGNIEQIMALDPDLIIAFSTDENLEKFESVAPTIPVEYEKWNYLDIHEEFGKIIGKEDEAAEWVNEWETALEEDKMSVEEAVGTDVTASVVEHYAKDIYVYGTNWGCGTEIIYQGLGLGVPEAVESEVVETGWKNISAEEVGKYAGDFMFVGTGDSGADNAYRETNVWKDLDAVKNDCVVELDSPTIYYNYPYSLEHQREIIVDELTEEYKAGGNMTIVKMHDVDLHIDKKNILDNINVELLSGKITTIIGPNGCGKSPMLKTVSNILHADGGAVYINDLDIRQMKSKQLAQKVSILSQRNRLQYDLKVMVLVSFSRYPYLKRFQGLKPDDYKIIHWALEETGADLFRDRMMSELSGGQAQRVW